MRHFLFFGILFSYILNLHSSEIYCLDSCRVMAVRNNKLLKIAEAKSKASNYERKSSLANFFPVIDFSTGYIFSSKNISLLNENQKNSLSNLGLVTNRFNDAYLEKLKITNPDVAQIATPILDELSQTLDNLGKNLVEAFNTDTKNMCAGAITITQPVYMGGKIMAFKKIAEYADEISILQTEIIKKDIIYEVDVAYWQIVSLFQKKELATEYIALLDTLCFNVYAMIDEGVATKADGLSVSVKRNEAEVMLSKIENAITLSKLSLAQLCGIDLSDDFGIADEFIATYDGIDSTFNAISFDKVFSLRDDIKSLELGVKIYEKKSKIELSELLPKLSVMGGYVVSNPNILNGFNNSFDGMFNIGVVLSVPILHSNNIFKVKIAKSEKSIAELDLAEAKDMVILQVKQAEFKVLDTEKRLKSCWENIEKAEENLRCANEGFKEGVLTLSNVMEAQNGWLQAKSELLDSEIDKRLCKIYLSMVLGNKIY